MKQLHFVFAAAVGIAAVAAPCALSAATNSGAYGASTADLTSGPAQPKKVTYEKYETQTKSKTYNVKDTQSGSLYYTAPAARQTTGYYTATPAARATTATVAAACPATGCPAAMTRTEVVKQEASRKYYLFHPFFQPQQYKFGSLTGLSYTGNSYDFKLKQGCSGATCLVYNPNTGNYFDGGSWNASQVAIKEDLSFGITDTVALLLMGRYSMSNYQIKWNQINIPKQTSESAKMKDNAFDQFGIGLQWRFLDNANWIGYVGGNYQWQNIASTIGLDGKVGYKVSMDTTVYGLLRGFYINWDEMSYGNGISSNGQNNFIALETGVKHTINFEGGIGVFSVLDPDWTVGAEAVLGDYSWHNQAWLGATIGWQPTNNFALSLYGKASVWDSASSANNVNIYVWADSDLQDPSFSWDDHCVPAALSNYREYSVGLQMALYF